MFNVKKKRRISEKNVPERHVASREPPFPIYIGLKIHAATGCKMLVEMLHKRGISISYDRALDLEEGLALAVCEWFLEDGIVVPAYLSKGLFTIGALDSLDYNPSSTTATSSFHGTGLSHFQFPLRSHEGERRPPNRLSPSSGKDHTLPKSYSTEPAVAIMPSSVELPSQETTPTDRIELNTALSMENSWMKHALPLLLKLNWVLTMFWLGLPSMPHKPSLLKIHKH